MRISQPYTNCVIECLISLGGSCMRSMIEPPSDVALFADQSGTTHVVRAGERPARLCTSCMAISRLEFVRTCVNALPLFTGGKWSQVQILSALLIEIASDDLRQSVRVALVMRRFERVGDHVSVPFWAHLPLPAAVLSLTAGQVSPVSSWRLPISSMITNTA